MWFVQVLSVARSPALCSQFLVHVPILLVLGGRPTSVGNTYLHPPPCRLQCRRSGTKEYHLCGAVLKQLCTIEECIIWRSVLRTTNCKSDPDQILFDSEVRGNRAPSVSFHSKLGKKVISPTFEDGLTHTEYQATFCGSSRIVVKTVDLFEHLNELKILTNFFF